MRRHTGYVMMVGGGDLCANQPIKS